MFDFVRLCSTLFDFVQLCSILFNIVQCCCQAQFQLANLAELRLLPTNPTHPHPPPGKVVIPLDMNQFGIVLVGNIAKLSQAKPQLSWLAEIVFIPNFRKSINKANLEAHIWFEGYPRHTKNIPISNQTKP